ncbi:Testis Expressed Sequence [Cucumispora dikerogammari]|nr:Testis Expressed Sequence [Cucumispora dikerogammari]
MFFEFLKSIVFLIIGFSFIVGLVAIIYKSVLFIERKPHAAKKNIYSIIHTIAALHLLLLIRGYSKLLILYSLIIIFIFYQLMYNYPDVQIESPYFITGTVMTLINHFLYLRVLADNSHNVFEVLVYFIIFVWVVPFCFFLSLSANDMLIHEGGRKRETYLYKLLKKVTEKINRGIRNDY